MFISFQEVLNSQVGVPLLTFIIPQELCGKATFLPHIREGDTGTERGWDVRAVVMSEECALFSSSAETIGTY